MTLDSICTERALAPRLTGPVRVLPVSSRDASLQEGREHAPCHGKTPGEAEPGLVTSGPALRELAGFPGARELALWLVAGRHLGLSTP